MSSFPETGGFPPPSGPPLPVELIPLDAAPPAPADEAADAAPEIAAETAPETAPEPAGRPQVEEPWLRDLERALGKTPPPEPTEADTVPGEGPLPLAAAAVSAAVISAAAVSEPTGSAGTGLPADAPSPSAATAATAATSASPASAAGVAHRGGARTFVAMPRWAKIGAAAALAFGVAAAGTAIQRHSSTSSNVLATTATATSPLTIANPTVAPTTAAPVATTVATTTTAAPSTSTTVAPTTTVTPTSAAPTTAAPPVTVPGREAAQVLAAIPVTAERTAGYAATQFPLGDVAADSGGCDLRSQTLRRDSRGPLTLDPADACKVVAGDWQGAYDGFATTDPAQLTATWTVSLREAWESGAAAWTAGQRAAYARDLADPRTVQLLSSAVVKARGDRDPAAWLPDGDARCPYLADWLAVKARWGLSMDRAEADRVAAVLRTDCTGLVVPAWAAVPDPPVVAEPTTPTTVPYYLDCADAARRGVTSIPRGAPGYRPALDGNGNGIACE